PRRRPEVGIAITGAGGGAGGIAGAIGVSSVNTTTIARIGDDADANQDASFGSSDQTVRVQADSRIGGTGKKLLGANDNNIIESFTTGRGSGAGGIAGFATSVDVVTLRPKALAEIGDNAKVRANDDIDVLAHVDLDVSANTFSFSGGAAAVNATVGVLTVGRGLDDDASDAAIGESNDDGDTAQSVAEEQLQIFDKVLGIESQAATAAGDAFNADARSEGATVVIGDGAVLDAGSDLTITAVTDLDLESLVGQGRGGLVSVGGSVNYITTGLSANVNIGTAILNAGRDEPTGKLLVQAYNRATASAEAFAGSIGAVTLGAQVAILNDSSSESIVIAESAQLMSAESLRIVAGRDQQLEALAAGGQLGGVVAGAAVGRTKVTGDTVVNIGENSLLSASSIQVGTDTNITTEAVSKSVAAGGVVAAASDAQSIIEPTIRTSIGSGVMFNATDAVIQTLARVNGKSDALGTGVGTVSTGPSVSESIVEPSMATLIGSATTFNVSGQVEIDTILARFNDDTRTVVSDATASAGGGLAISAGTSDAILSGTVTTVLADGVQFNSTDSVTIASTSQTDAFARMLAAAGAIIAAGDSDATSQNALQNRVFIGESLIASDVDTLNVNATGDNAVVAFDVSGTGGIISGASALATTINTGQSQVHWNDTVNDSDLQVNDLNITTNQIATIRSAVDSVNASVAGGVGVYIRNTVSNDSEVILGSGLDAIADTIDVVAANRVVKELPRTRKPAIDKDQNDVIDPDEETKPIQFDVNSGSGGVVDVPSANSETVVFNRATITSNANLIARDALGLFAIPSLALQDRVRLTSGGAGSGVTAISSIEATPAAIITVSGDLISAGDLVLTSAPE
ncbi:MAG: hypothetical protein AAF539_16345, partial [Planctomycetota bacterium]